MAENKAKGMMRWLDAIVKDEKKLRVLIFCGLGLVGLLFVIGLFPSEKKEDATPQLVGTQTDEEYRAWQEKRMETFISQIEGVGHAEVLLTLEHGSETVYQSDKNYQTDRQTASGETQKVTENNQESIVITEENGEKTALVKTQKTPVIQGVVVVCDGANSIAVQTQVTQAVTTAYGLSTARVAIVERAQTSMNEKNN